MTVPHTVLRAQDLLPRRLHRHAHSHASALSVGVEKEDETGAILQVAVRIDYVSCLRVL